MEIIVIKKLNFRQTILTSSEKISRAILQQKQVEILNNVNLSLEKGELLCVSGKSGEGKTTLLRIIAGLEKADSGEISLFGESIKQNEWNALSMAQKGIGFVFQNNALISDLTVKENIALSLRYHKMGTEEEIAQKVERALLLMLASKYANDYPYSLSLGMKKRIAIARSWALDTKILLLDEPTAGLDKNSRNNLLSLLENLRELHSTTIIMVENDLSVARDLRSKISFIINKKLTTPMFWEDIKNNEDSRIRAMLR
jgi:phospholipid/cholesterol/gamma-HCH transport system ATP-binding protein